MMEVPSVPLSLFREELCVSAPLRENDSLHSGYSILSRKATPCTGLILTKQDCSGKGGVTVAIARETGIPPRYVGTGESASDFALFDRAA